MGLIVVGIDVVGFIVGIDVVGIDVGIAVGLLLEYLILYIDTGIYTKQHNVYIICNVDQNSQILVILSTVSYYFFKNIQSTLI